jgi:hypothetical protein
MYGALKPAIRLERRMISFRTLLKGGAEMDVAVGIWRTVVKDKQETMIELIKVSKEVPS